VSCIRKRPAFTYDRIDEMKSLTIQRRGNMVNVKRYSCRTVALLTSIALLAGCSSNSSGNGDGADPIPTVKPPDPVLLQIASQGVGTLLDDSFMQIVNDQLKKKYPHISINYNPEVKGSTLDEL